MPGSFFSFPPDAPRPALPPAATGGGVEEIRPGLTLTWGEHGRPRLPAGAVVGVLCQLSAPAGRMRLLVAAADDPAEEPFDFHVLISLSSAALETLLAGDATDGANLVRHCAADGTVATATLRPLTPAARLALESIRRCPFVGACRAMALTARCHDLLLEFLSALAQTPDPRPPALLASQSDRIRAAAEWLHRDLEHPPTLAALAARAGLSETTLKRGFHQVFGTTVFGYIRTQRMEQARQLLEAGHATVLEAAARVGYSNPSNFATAFRRQFGVNPKAFQLAARRHD